jgi:hypothetical protein
MQSLIFQIFLTLVLFKQTSFAAPNQDVDLDSTTSQSESSLNEKKNSLSLEEQLLNATTPPPMIFNEVKEEYYPYMQSISPRLGTLLNMQTFTEEKGNAFKMLYGFQYLFPRYRSPQLEVGADLIKDFNGQIHFSKRWTINDRSSFRPFYKLGVLIQAVGKEGIATFTNYENYLLKTGIGFEDMYKKPLSIRLDFEVAIGFENVFAFFTLGYSWGF